MKLKFNNNNRFRTASTFNFGSGGRINYDFNTAEFGNDRIKTKFFLAGNASDYYGTNMNYGAGLSFKTGFDCEQCNFKVDVGHKV